MPRPKAPEKTNAEIMEQEMWTMSDLSQITGRTPSTLWRWAKEDGRIPHVIVGKSTILFDRDTMLQIFLPCEPDGRYCPPLQLGWQYTDVGRRAMSLLVDSMTKETP